ncbi:MAG TPA: universal stress protein [Chitinophagaceae bacterium]|nr:universal stress protein [Chitinophagaceae bacterium]
MRTIIAPIDFSDASANALSFAAELSKRAAARLIVINILQKGEDEDETKNKLQSVESSLKKSFGSGLNCESTLAHGNFITSLKKIIAAQRPDLIVMGTKGASGLKKILIGSNTVNVLANTKVPVLVIPEVARFENFLNRGKNRIVLATDLDLLENEQALEILREIGKLISESRISVLSVRPENTHLPDLKRMERDYLLSYFTPDIETERITVFGSNVINGINFYLNKNEDSGLIAMIARDSGHLIQKHYTREMASHTHYPLLVMHDAKP